MTLYTRYYASGGPPAAAPVVASSSVGQGNNVTAVTCAKPTGLAANDLLVFFGITRDASATNEWSRSGFTKIDPTGSTSGTRTTPLWKVADSGDAGATDFEFTADGTVEAAGGVLIRVTGAATSSPIASSVELMQTSAVDPWPCPTSGTVASGNYLALVSVSIENDVGDIVSPTDYAEVRELQLNYGRDATLVVASQELSGITAEDPGDFSSVTIGAFTYHAWTLLVKP